MTNKRFKRRRTPSGVIVDAVAGHTREVTQPGQIHYTRHLVHKGNRRYVVEAFDNPIATEGVAAPGTYIGVWSPVDEDAMATREREQPGDTTLHTMPIRGDLGREVNNEGAGYPDFIQAIEAARRDLMAQPDDESE